MEQGPAEDIEGGVAMKKRQVEVIRGTAVPHFGLPPTGHYFCTGKMTLSILTIHSPFAWLYVFTITLSG